jgi:RHS repeat-associated protein
VQAQLDAAGTPTYLLTDALGSVRGAADTAGTLVGRADYDAFGAVRGPSTTGSVFGFTGEQTDPETGLVYLRARSYAPSSGRLLSADSVQPNAPGTQGSNRYTYGRQQPHHLDRPQRAPGHGPGARSGPGSLHHHVGSQ